MNLLIQHLFLVLEKGLTRILFSILWLFQWKKSIVKANLKHCHFEYKCTWNQIIFNVSQEISAFIFTALRKGKISREIYVDPVSKENLLKMRKSGGILLTHHFGNFEILGYFLNQKNIPLIAFYLPPKSKWFHSFLQFLRSRQFHYTFPANTNLRKSIRHIQNNGTLAFLNDQDAGITGEIIPMFHNPASASKLPQQIQKLSQANIYHGILKREKNIFNLIIEQKEINNSLAEDSMKFLEKQIIETPSQWFGWLHRRFKTTSPNIYK